MNAAFAVLGAEFAVPKVVYNVYWMGSFYMMSWGKTASAVLISALEMFHEERNIILLNLEWKYWRGNSKNRKGGIKELRMNREHLYLHYPSNISWEEWWPLCKIVNWALWDIWLLSVSFTDILLFLVILWCPAHTHDWKSS